MTITIIVIEKKNFPKSSVLLIWNVLFIIILVKAGGYFVLPKNG